MANINIENISDLNLNGNDLFGDSESFMTEVTDDELNIIGGKAFTDKTWHWTSVVPGSGLVVATVAITIGDTKDNKDKK
ncbi:MAG: hypothetical protein WBM44_14275 [Waterburya sp.]